MAVPGSFRAFRVHEVERKIEARLETLRLDELAAGDVVIRVAYSSINYKDALAATGAGRILRRYPLVGGIDLAGTVVSSDDPRHRAGDRVLVTGCGLSETHDGGYTEYARVKGEWVIPLPAVRNRILAGGGSGRAKLPFGAASRTTVPDGTPLTRWLDRNPSGIAFTAIEISLPSCPGGEVNEYDRQCHRPSTGTPMPMYWPGR